MKGGCLRTAAEEPLSFSPIYESTDVNCANFDGVRLMTCGLGDRMAPGPADFDSLSTACVKNVRGSASSIGGAEFLPRLLLGVLDLSKDDRRCKIALLLLLYRSFLLSIIRLSVLKERRNDTFSLSK